MYTYKKTYAWKYEMAVCNATGKIVWVSGPYRGSLNDYQILEKSGLLQLLHPYEVIYGDTFYHSKELMLVYRLVSPYPIDEAKKYPKAYVQHINKYIRQRRVQVDRTFGRVK